MAGERVGGIIHLKVDGAQYAAKGEFTYDLGVPKRDAVVGTDGVHGYKEEPKVAYIEGAMTDGIALDVKTICGIVDSTVTLEVANGKMIVLRNAWYAGDGAVKTGEGEMAVRFEGLSAAEI
jgi:hypothetical protein